MYEKSWRMQSLCLFPPDRSPYNPVFLSWNCGMHTTSWLGGTMDRLKASGTCLPLPSFSCWGISVLVRRCGNNPLSSRPFLYRHDPESEGENTEDYQPPCWVQTPLRLIERKGQRSQPGVTGPDRLNILIDLLPFRERQCSLTLDT